MRQARALTSLVTQEGKKLHSHNQQREKEDFRRMTRESTLRPNEIQPDTIDSLASKVEP